MSVRRNAARTLGALALAAPLLAVSVPQALAAGSWSSPTPADGAVLSSNGFTVQVAVSSRSSAVTLSVTGRAAGSAFCSASTSSNGGPLSGAQTLTLTFPASSGGCAAARNAQWTAVLSGGASGSRSFTTNAVPAAPSGFSAQGSGARDVSFTWSRGSEADLSGYTLYDGSGSVIDSAIDLSHCSGSVCAYGLYYPSDNPGSHDYQLSARRASGGCSSCGSSLESPSKASSSATLTPPPKPTPSPTPDPTTAPDGGGTGSGTTGDGSTGGATSGGSTTGGSTGGSGSGSSTGGSGTGTSGSGTAIKPGTKPAFPSLTDPAVASRRTFALQFSAFAPSLGIPKLPPLPATSLPALSGEGAFPAGTYDPALPYQPKTTTEKTTSVLSQPVAAFRDVLDSTQLAKSIAVALILLMAGAHLRRFLGTHVEE